MVLSCFVIQSVLLFSHYEIKATLWGDRAAEFTVHKVYDAAEKKPVVILLVGTLPKTYQGIFTIEITCTPLTESQTISLLLFHRTRVFELQRCLPVVLQPTYP